MPCLCCLAVLTWKLLQCLIKDTWAGGRVVGNKETQGIHYLIVPYSPRILGSPLPSFYFQKLCILCCSTSRVF